MNRANALGQCDRTPPQPHGRAGFLLPGVAVSLSATKPELLADQGDWVGARLRRVRKARSLRQIAAAMMGVCQTPIVDWEGGTKQPTDRQYFAILRFLGYEPWPEAQTLAEQLVADRRRRGISQARLQRCS